MSVLSHQAVVIVHGIGEQVPLDTVRRFVGRRTVRAREHHEEVGVAGDEDRVFSEPSPVGTRADDRTYLVTWNHTGLAREIADEPEGWRPQERVAVTDFYEFYWAPSYRSTTMGQLTGWILPILRRPRSSFSSPRLVGPSGWVRLVPPVCLLGAFVAVLLGKTTQLTWWGALAIAAPLVLVAVLVGTALGLIGTVRVLALAMVTAVAICIVIWGLGSFVSVVKTVTASAAAGLVLGFAATRATRVLGDAARYLSARPDSVEENDLLRQQVLGLLERLHEAKDPDSRRPRYDRIVVVGHSLGSVIAYDAVRLLWAGRYRAMVLPGQDDPSLVAQAVREVEEAGERLKAAPADQAEAARNTYVAAQRRAQRVMRDLGGGDGTTRWIITDLVTLGSPLTYADALMATGPDDLADRFEERSLAAIPPVAQQVRRAAGHPYRLWVPGPGNGPGIESDAESVAGPVAGPVPGSVPGPVPGSGDAGSTRWHHAAPFACVSWTNLWFEHDIVGGPVGPHFGPGVDDRSLGGSKWLAAFAFAYPHSSYWVASRDSLVRTGSLTSLRFLHETVWRPPTLLLTARATLTDQQVADVVGLLGGGDPQRPEVDIRLYVGYADTVRSGAYLPLGRVPLPTAFIGQRLRDVLGPGSRLALLTSPDVLADDRGPTTDTAGAAGSAPAPDEVVAAGRREPIEGDSLAARQRLPMRGPGIPEQRRFDDGTELEVDTAGEEE